MFENEIPYWVKLIFWVLPLVIALIAWALIEILRKIKSWISDEAYKALGTSNKITRFFSVTHKDDFFILFFLCYLAFVFLAAWLVKIAIGFVLVVFLTVVFCYGLRSFIRFKKKVNDALNDGKFWKKQKDS